MHHSRATRTARPDARGIRQRGEPSRLRTDQHIIGIAAPKNGTENEPMRQLDRQILQAMHRGVRASFEDGVFQLLGEDPSASQSRQVFFGMTVTGGADDFLAQRKIRPSAEDSFADHA